jgi:hypothetical protein
LRLPFLCASLTATVEYFTQPGWKIIQILRHESRIYIYIYIYIYIQQEFSFMIRKESRLLSLCVSMKLRVYYTWTSWPLKMGPIVCPETSVRTYRSTLSNIPEAHRFHVGTYCQVRTADCTGFLRLCKVV